MIRTKINIIIFFFMIVLGGIVYSNSLNNGYHFDDLHYIVGNPYITSLRNVPAFFTDHRTLSRSPEFQAHYRPLLLTSYSINYYFGRLKPAGYHVGNLLFHIGSSFLVFLIVRKILNPLTHPPDRPSKREKGAAGEWHMAGIDLAAIASGMIFLVHPFNTEVVNYIWARSSVMCAFFFMLAFWCWMCYRYNPPLSPFNKGGSRGIYYLASLLSFVLAMLTKEVAITLPLILWLYDLYFVPVKGWLRNIRRTVIYLPFVLVVVTPYIIMRLFYFGSVLPSFQRSILVQLYTEMPVLVKYLRLILIPAGLNADHHVEIQYSLFNVPVIGSAIVLIALVLAAVYLFRQVLPERRVISFFIFWFFIVLLPTTIIPLNAILQENRGYLSGISIAVISGIIFGYTSRYANSAARNMVSLSFGLLAVLLIFFSALTWSRNTVWKDTMTLWSDVQKKNPHSQGARIELGRIQMAENPGQAEAVLKESLQRFPQSTMTLISLGNLYVQKGDYLQAERLYLNAIEIEPGNYKAHFNLAKVYKERGDRESALREYREVIRLSPTHVVAAEILAGLYLEMGKADELEEEFRNASVRTPSNPAFHRGLGIIYSGQQMWDKAIVAFKKVLEITPDDVSTLLDLGNSYMKRGEFDSAAKMFHRVLELEPGNGMASQGLGVIYQQRQEYDLALKYYEKAVEGRNASPRILNNMGFIYLATDKTDMAIQVLKSAIEVEPSYSMARINLGIAYEKQNRFEDAKKEYLKVIQGRSEKGQSDKFYIEARRRLDNLR